jgi:hypothetical protein
MIIERVAISILTIMLMVDCSAQSSTECDGEVEIQYEKTSRKTKRDGLETDRKMKSVSIEFLNNFNHKIKGYINGELQFEDVVVTDDVTRMSEKYFGYNYSKDVDLPVIKVSIEGLDKCFEIKVLEKYKLIYVFLSENNEITVRYSNTIYETE